MEVWKDPLEDSPKTEEPPVKKTNNKRMLSVGIDNFIKSWVDCTIDSRTIKEYFFCSQFS